MIKYNILRFCVSVNENFGFGVLDASVLVNKAKKLNVSVPAQVMCVLNVTAERG